MDYKELSSKEEAERFQKEYYEEYCEQLSRKRKVMSEYKYRNSMMSWGIEGYLGDNFRSINDYMRFGNCTSEQHAVKLDSIIDSISELIICAPKIPENLVVFRGIDDKGMQCIINNMKQHEEQFFEEAFMSTSLLYKTVVEEFPSINNVMKIYVPAGTHALGVDNFKDRNENEILFPPHQWLKFIEKSKDKKAEKWIFSFELVNYYMF